MEPYLLVQVFPAQEWQKLVIIRDLVISNKVWLDLRILRAMVAETLSQVTGQDTEAFENEVFYSVQVIAASVSKMTSLKYKSDYASAGLSRQLENALNNNKEQIRLSLSGITNESFFVIIPALRDVARLYYEIPREPFTVLDYEIGVYDGRDPVRKSQILAYIDRILAYNETLDTPLELISPVFASELDDPLMVLFIATRGDQVIGYCGCNLLRYRLEIAPLLDEVMREGLLKEDMGLRERYFMGEVPRDFYEIKGLSVDPNEARKNIALMLLYYAMDFIREPVVSLFYPVTHIITQAASYITKRLLVTNFRFRYHGMNQFMNETFFETISPETKTLFVRMVTEFLGYYTLLFRQRRDTLRGMLRGRRGISEQVIKKTPVLAVIRDTVRIYQLYFLLLRTTVRARAFDCYSQETLDQFIQLFSEIVSTLDELPMVYLPLKRYFEQNLVTMRAYREKRDITLFETSIYTQTEIAKGEKKPAEPVASYGFLKKPLKGGSKMIFLEGYEFIYASVKNTIELMVALLDEPLILSILSDEGEQNEMKEKTQMESYLKRILGLTNGLVKEDLQYEYNYEIPYFQLSEIQDAIRDTLNYLEKTPFNQLRDQTDLVATSRAIQKKIFFIKRNIMVNKRLTNDVFNIAPLESDGADTLISLEQLQLAWQEIQAIVEARIGYKAQEEVPVVSVCPIAVASTKPVILLDVPENQEERNQEIEILYNLLKQKPSSQSEVSFKGNNWPVSLLKEYYNKLMATPESSPSSQPQQPQQQQQKEEVVEEPKAVYSFENFKVDYLRELNPASRFNTRSFI